MPEIQAFRAIRYNLGHIGTLSDVVAPPYDVIDPELQDQLYKRHPCNIVRLILNRIEPGDDDAANNRYTRAGQFFRNWLAEGVLVTDPDPALYVYHQQYDYEGHTYTRRGFMARMRISPFGQGRVFPHEHTKGGPKMDRLMLTVVCKANLSQIFGLYPDPNCETQAVLEEAIAGPAPIEATDHLGAIHRIWPVTDVAVIAQVSALMGPKPVFIADGHHRYETACRYRDQVYDSGFLSPQHPANYVLMALVAMEDPGLLVLPCHRLVSGTPPISAEQLVARLGRSFTCHIAGLGPEAAGQVWQGMQQTGRQDVLGLYAAADGRWVLARLSESGRSRMDEVAKDHQEPWRRLGVSILHELVFADLLGWEELAELRYVQSAAELSDALCKGGYSLAALVMPASVDDIRQVSLTGERLPPKSTYFYPKLLCGLVINPLE